MVHIGSSLGSPSSDVEQSLSSDVSASLPRLRAGRPDRSAIEKGDTSGVPPRPLHSSKLERGREGTSAVGDANLADTKLGRQESHAKRKRSTAPQPRLALLPQLIEGTDDDRGNSNPAAQVVLGH